MDNNNYNDLEEKTAGGEDTSAPEVNEAAAAPVSTAQEEIHRVQDEASQPMNDGIYHYSYRSGTPVPQPTERPHEISRETSQGTPAYSADHVSGTGSISYTASHAPEKKQGGVSKAAIAVLVIVGIIASMGFGMIGAYITNTYFAADSGASAGNVSSTVIYRNVESVTTSSDGSELTYADVELIAGDSVVAITTEYQSVGLWQYVTSGAGSGVIMSEDGYIITNNHVVVRSDNSSKYADKITVVLKNGEEYEATVIGGSSEADIAVIKIEPQSQLVAAVFADSNTLAVGEEVIAIGNPLGELSGTMTNGIISALAREIEVDGVNMNLLQTNAAINPGNSGGGLFNMKGELIGIVNAKSSGTGIEGLGFAIPSNDALAVATEIIEKGSVASSSTTKIGISLVDIFTQEDAYKYGVNSYGVYVAEVEEGYNDSVLKAGDRLLAVNDQEITGGDDVVEIVKAAQPGDVLKFVLYRSGRLMSVDVTCYDSSEESVEF